MIDTTNDRRYLPTVLAGRSKLASPRVCCRLGFIIFLLGGLKRCRGMMLRLMPATFLWPWGFLRLCSRLRANAAGPGAPRSWPHHRTEKSLLQDVARVRRADQSVPDQLLCGLLHGRHVPRMRPVPLFQREPRITRRQALRARAGEGDVAPREGAKVVLKHPAVEIPAGVRGRRRQNRRRPDSANVVAIRVHLGHEDRVLAGADARRLDGEDAGLVRRVEERAVGERAERIRESQEFDGRSADAAVVVRGDVGEVDARGRHERAVTQPRSTARRRLDALLQPIGERDPERPLRLQVAVGVQLLLAPAERRRKARRKGSGAMLRTGLQEGPDEVRVMDVVTAQGVRQAEGLPTFPDLERGREVEDLRTRFRLEATPQYAVGLPCDRIVRLAIGERELIRGIEMIGNVAPRATGLTEADVERGASAADEGEGSVEDDAF